MKGLFRPRSADAFGARILALQLTAITLLTGVIPGWYARPGLLLLAGLGVLFPAVLRTPAVWAGITLLIGASLFREWPLLDNHIYLFAYWSLAIFLALRAERPEESLAISARWLLAFVFLWATIWKGVLAPDYLDGRFYRVALATDFRFEAVAQFLAGLSAEQIAENRAFLERLPTGVWRLDAPGLVEPPGLVRLAHVLTWTTLLFEAAVALAFLLPWGRWTEIVRHGLLLTFCVTAYALAPVAGFGWLIVMMGIAQVPERRGLLRMAYLAIWFLILIYQEVPLLFRAVWR